MKNRIIRILFASALSFTAIGAFASARINNRVSEQPVEVKAAAGDYYSEISDSLSGTALLNALNALNNKKRARLIGYDGLKTTFRLTERASSVPSDKMVGFYDNTLVNASWDNQATWNREHVWPNSRGGGSKGGLSSPYVDADIHMVRPASVSTNSSRGNLMFGTSGNSYDPGQFVAEYRGISARIIFYCAIADTRLSLTENVNDASSNHTMGKLSDLLRWNLEYAPNTSSSASLALQVEQNRNETIYSNSSLQGNRNPFIDHPEYACKIWGNTNAETKAICSGQAPTPEETSISLNETEKTLQIGNTFELIATTSDGSQIAWSTDDSSFEVIQISPWTTTSESPLRVKAVGEGTANITATSGQNKVTCVITVVKELPPEQNEEPTNNKNNKALYIGLGIGLGVLLIAGVVVLIVVLTRRKKVV